MTWRALILGRLRGRGWTWWLSMLWVAAGAVNTGYYFYLTTRPYTWADDDLGISGWSTDPKAVQFAIFLATVTWLALAIPVLIAGFIRLGGLRRRFWLRAAGWAGAWIAGIALMYETLAWAVYPGNYSQYPTPGCGGPAGCPAVVSWGELALCAAWLALGAVMTWILPSRRQGRPSPKVADKSMLAPVES